MTNLFDPIRVGDLDLPNRIFMAPLTRARATDDRVPTEIMRDYYVQRASSGLILTEATCITPDSVGYHRTPGIWSPAQIAGWAMITKAVHQAGGRIFMQLWHCGRISDPSLLGGEAPVAPSAIAAQGHVSLLRPERPYPLAARSPPGGNPRHRGGLPHARPRTRWRRVSTASSCMAPTAICSTSSCKTRTNKRTDAYGGAVENRARLMLEAVDAAICCLGFSERVGLHLAPRGDAHSMGDSDPLGTFSYVAREARKRNLAFLFAREHEAEDSIGAALKREFGGVYIANERFTIEQSAAAPQRGFGRCHRLRREIHRQPGSRGASARG